MNTVRLIETFVVALSAGLAIGYLLGRVTGSFQRCPEPVVQDPAWFSVTTKSTPCQEKEKPAQGGL